MSSSDWLNFLVLGLPTWTLVDGTWAALSQLANTLPEGYNISSYLILSLTLGNIFPLMVGYAIRTASTAQINQLIKLILITGWVTGLMMGIFWNSTVIISGGQTSFPLFILFFIVGACSSTSNVTHYTYVSRYHGSDTTALGTGMGVGSMVAGILALLQGFVLEQIGFSVTAYYITLSCLYIPALYVFNQLSRSYRGNLEETDYLSKQESQEVEYDEVLFLKQNYPILLLFAVNSSLGYGFVPALISYACGKFENAELVLLLATGLAAVIDPCFKALTNYYRLKTMDDILKATAVLVLLCLGLILCASLPGDISLYKGGGGALPILLYISFGSLFGFSSISIFRYFKDKVPGNCVQHAYRWSGIASQSGALVGSLFAFFLVITGSL